MTARTDIVVSFVDNKWQVVVHGEVVERMRTIDAAARHAQTLANRNDWSWSIPPGAQVMTAPRDDEFSCCAAHAQQDRDDDMHGDARDDDPADADDDREFCAEHGMQAVTDENTFSGYAGGVCYAVTLACGCALTDESNDVAAAR